MNKLPTYYLSHGGGPWPWIRGAFGPEDMMDSLENYLIALGQKHKHEIDAILVISAHWEEKIPTVHLGKNPPMLYDYSGFPAHTYEIQFPAPGAPELGLKVMELLKNNGFNVRTEEKRGFDHGTFVPLKVAFPNADIPILQLSLINHLDAAEHIRLGQALEPLREQRILIIGSGFSYHNLRKFFSKLPSTQQEANEFDFWLNQAVEMPHAEQRNEALCLWEKAPFAYECHPRSEHLTPLFVAAGAAGNDLGVNDFKGEMFGIPYSGFKFG